MIFIVAQNDEMRQLMAWDLIIQVDHNQWISHSQDWGSDSVFWRPGSPAWFTGNDEQAQTIIWWIQDQLYNSDPE